MRITNERVYYLLPFTTEMISTDLVYRLTKTPREVVRLSASLTDEQLRTRPSPEEFSAIEHVCHLRDIEIEAYTVRISRIISEATPQLADVDGARLAAERDYNSESLSDALESFKRSRRSNLEAVSELDEDTLKRTGQLEGVGEITIRRLLEMMQDHDESHLNEMTSLRRRLLSE